MSAPPKITTQLRLLRILGEQVDPRIRARSVEYLPFVDIETCTEDEVQAEVIGYEPHDVTAKHAGGVVRYACTCPYFSESFDACKHVWAVITLAVPKGFLRGVPADVDPEFVPSEEDVTPREGGGRTPDVAEAKQPPEPAWERTVRSWLSRAPAESRLHPAAEPPLEVQLRVAINEFAREGALVLEVSFRETRANGTTKEIPGNKMKRATALRRLPTETAAPLAMLCGGADGALGPYAFFEDAIPTTVRVTTGIAPLVLPGLCQRGCVVLPIPNAEAARLAWDGHGAWDLVVRLVPREADRVSVVIGLQRGDARISWSDVVAVSEGGMLVTKSAIGTVNVRGGGPILSMLQEGGGSLTVPRADVPRLIGKLLEFPNLPPIMMPDDFDIGMASVRPVPEVHVTSQQGPWGRATHLTFDYGGRKTGMNERLSGWCGEGLERGQIAIVRRDRAFEAEVRARMVALGFRAEDFGTSDFAIAAKRLPQALREMIAAGWRVTADGRAFRQASEWRLSVSSGVDWFDLEGGADFDGEIVPLPRLLAAARKGEKTVVLGDGSLGILPEEWIRKHGGLAGLGKADGSRVRFAKGQAGLLDALLAAQPDVPVDAAFSRARERLRTFDRIAPAVEPASFRGELRPYQREALAWLTFLEEFGFGGCLADDMGLGKTVEVLAYLVARKRTGPVLVVCPRSLIFNWKSEAARFAPKLRVLDHSAGDRKPPGPHFGVHDLVLTTYGILRKDAPHLAKIAFDVVILDEAQAIKNRETESAKAARLLKAGQRLALSGTPIENRLTELGSLFEFLNPGLLGSAAAFDGLASAGDPDAIAGLARAVRPFLLRRTKEQVVKDLPQKTEQTISCELEGPQRKLYDELRDHYRGALLGKIAEAGLKRVKIQVLEALLRLRQAACHPGLIDPARAEESSPKLDLLLERLEEVVAEGHKALVFSQFTSLLAIVKPQLDARGITYEYLDGATRDREARVTRFRSDPACPVFLISLKAGGLGLNLVEADYVFLLDPWWNPAVEAQAIDRTHRIGQTRSVFAYRLIARDTVEEKVLELQGRKRALADAIIQADESLIRSLTREDLVLLLS